MREKVQTHLTMMAATSVKMQQEFQAKLQEQERRFEGRCSTQEEFQAKQGRSLEELQKQLEVEKSSHKQELQEQEKKFQEKFQEQEKRFEKQERNFREMVEMKIREQRMFFEDFKTGAKTELEELKRRCGVWKVTMKNFSKEKAKDKCNDWNSPPMYTHPGGYKFCIGIDANGTDVSSHHGRSVNVDVWVMMGEYDDQLQWPVTAKFTLELINHFENGENKTCTITPTSERPKDEYWRIGEFLTVPNKQFHFIYHSELPHNPVTRTHFLKNDTLNFHLSCGIIW